MIHNTVTGAATGWLLLAVAAIGCSFPFGPTGPRIQVSLIVQQAVVSISSATVDVGGRSVSLRAADIVGQRSDDELAASKYGLLPVQVRLLNSAGDTVAVVAYAQSFERGYSYGIGALVSRMRPIGFCAGTILATPLRTSPADTLFVSYSGLPTGAVC